MADTIVSPEQALQRRIAALQAENQQLRQLLEQQGAQTQAWMARRTAELEVEARASRKAETLQQVFYKISERATAGLSFFEFLQSVHGLLGELLYAKNCYVCLYNAQKHTLDFPYYVDEKDGDTMQGDDVPYKDGLTEFVLRTGQPQLIDSTRFESLQSQGEITEASGDLTFNTWLGVPMQIRGAIGGVLVVQSYEEGVRYTDADTEVLSFVANHFSTAIERYQAIDALKISEQRYRSVIENVGVGVVVAQDGKLVFANPSAVRIVGHPQEYLLSQHLTATIHPDDREEVMQRHMRRLRGEEVESEYSFRIVRPDGEVRLLELSAVQIEWNQRAATLLFLIDATDRIEAAQAQKLALYKQIELTDMKSRFISMTSHEFRTPLATIHGSVELLMHYEDRMPADKKRMTLEKIDDSVARMTHMLENVLLIGRTNAGLMEFRPKPLGLRDFCMGLLDELRSAMTAHYLTLRWVVELPAAQEQFLLDDALMRNIVENLLSNAIKYSPGGGEVRLAAAFAEGVLTITVTDQGIGIPLKDQSNLFESFHRASNVGAIAGTGLGLTIVREAVQRHGGTINVHSEVGVGSSFTVTLPTKQC
jgi:PAS domain S-box-containing protein